VISWLAENSDDEHLKKVKQNAEQHALKMEVASRSLHDESALFDEDEAEDDEIVLGRDDKPEAEKETSEQRLYSLAKVKPEFEGLRAPSSGHKIQDIKELMTVPVRCFLTIPDAYPYLHRNTGHCHRRSYQIATCHQSIQLNPYAEEKK